MITDFGENRTPYENTVFGKTSNSSQIREGFEEEHIKVAHKGPSNKSPQQISRDLGSNTKNEKSQKIHPKIPKKKKREKPQEHKI